MSAGPVSTVNLLEGSNGYPTAYESQGAISMTCVGQLHQRPFPSLLVTADVALCCAVKSYPHLDTLEPAPQRTTPDFAGDSASTHPCRYSASFYLGWFYHRLSQGPCTFGGSALHGISCRRLLLYCNSCLWRLLHFNSVVQPDGFSSMSVGLQWY